MKPGPGALAIAAAVALAACKAEKPEYAGIGPYSVKRTKLKDAPGRCDPTDLPDGRKGTWCSLQPQLAIAGKPADVDLYFLGTEPGAPLIEEQVQVRGCQEDALLMYLRKNFGDPVEDHGTRVFWKNRAIYLIGIAPSEPGRCMVRVFPLSEAAEYERVKAKLLTRP